MKKTYQNFVICSKSNSAPSKDNIFKSLRFCAIDILVAWQINTVLTGTGWRVNIYLWMMAVALKPVDFSCPLFYPAYSQLTNIFPNRIGLINPRPPPGNHLHSAAVVPAALLLPPHKMVPYVFPESMHAVWCLLRRVPSIFWLLRSRRLSGRCDSRLFDL